jgi:asparagine synthetase B (glutamine-hydrolysing)
VETLSVLPGWQVDELLPGDAPPARELARAAVRRWVDDDDPPDTLNELLRLETRFSLADDLLLIADHFSMRSSVELRVPFLDLELLELVERMPGRYKVSGFGARKWLYRTGAVREIPRPLRASLAGRRARFGRKRGFNAPVTAWFDAGGPIGSSDEWQDGLKRYSEISLPVANAIALEPDDSQNARKRVALYALSQWLVDGPLVQAQAGPSLIAGER